MHRFLVPCLLLLAGLSSPLIAKEHGYITSIPMDHPAENVFRVNIEKIDGKMTNAAVNHAATPGSREVEVSLVFNPSYGVGMEKTAENVYYKTMTFDVEAGKTYFIGAKVDTHASAEAQDDGSFWEPLIYETK